MRLNSVESISRAEDRQKFHGKASRSFSPPSLFRPPTASSPCGSQPFLLPSSLLLLPLFHPFVPADTDTVCALSLHLFLTTWSYYSCNFHASKTTDTPCDDRSPSSTANFSSFCLNGTVLPQPVRRGWTNLQVLRKTQTASIRGVILICYRILFVDFL